MNANAITRARVGISAVTRGVPVSQAITEMMGPEDELASYLGQSSGAVGSALSEMGYTQDTEFGQDFESGSVQVWTASNPEEPANDSRVYLCVKNGSVDNLQHDAVASLPPENLAAHVASLAKQWGLTRPADSAAQPPSGGVGTSQPQA